MLRAKILTTIMLLMLLFSFSTSAQNEPATTATGTVISAELQKILDEDEDLKNTIDEVNPEKAFPLSEENLEEISHAEAFCFNKSTRTMMLWGENFEGKVMVWGPGLRDAFLAALKTGRLTIVPTTFVPEITSAKVWTPIGKIKPKCYIKGPNQTKFYRVKQ